MLPKDQAVQRVPTLPTRSSLRPSKFLEPLVTKPDLANEQPPLSPATAPHDVYLSSEEDASSSADDFSDFEIDSDIDIESLPASPLSSSHSDTARLVSVVFHGKPSLVDHRPRSTSPLSLERQIRGSIPLSPTDPTMPTTNKNHGLGHRRSISSSSSSIFSFARPASTMLPSRHGQKPSFLNIDPFASSKAEVETSNDTNQRPRTPTTMLKRRFTLSNRRKGPSMTEAAAQSRDNLSIHSMPVDDKFVDEQPPTPPSAGRYQDTFRAAQNSSRGLYPAENIANGAKSLLRGGLSLNRWKSVKS